MGLDPSWSNSTEICSLTPMIIYLHYLLKIIRTKLICVSSALLMLWRGWPLTYIIFSKAFTLCLIKVSQICSKSVLCGQTWESKSNARAESDPLSLKKWFVQGHEAFLMPKVTSFLLQTLPLFLGCIYLTTGWLIMSHQSPVSGSRPKTHSHTERQK